MIRPITTILALVSLAAIADDSYLVTSTTTNHDSRGKGAIGSIERMRTFRGTNKVYEVLRVDSDGDGSLDATQQLFWARGVAIVRIGGIKKNDSGMQFSSKDNIEASLQDTNQDGTIDTILLISDEFQLIELYRRTADGLFSPIDADEYRQAIKGAQSIAPFATTTLKAIEDKK